MAISGGATVAYLCQMIDGELVILRSTSTLRSECVPVAEAIDWLSAGQRVIVAGADMAALRTALGEKTVADAPGAVHYPEDWV